MKKLAILMVPLLILGLTLGAMACGGGEERATTPTPREEEIVPTPTPSIGTMEVVVADQVYRYERDGFGGIGGETGIGPTLDTANDENWPHDNPRLTLSVMLRGFPRNEGIPSGTTIDLSSETSVASTTIWFTISTPRSEIVGAPPPIYASYKTAVGKHDTSWVPGSAGTVHITEFSLKEDSDRYPSALDYRMDIRLKNVVLQKVESNESADGQVWPAEVSIPTAHFCNLGEPCLVKEP